MTEQDIEKLAFEMNQQKSARKAVQKTKRVSPITDAKRLISLLSDSDLKQIFYLASKEAKRALKPGTPLEEKINEIQNLFNL